MRLPQTLLLASLASLATAQITTHPFTMLIHLSSGTNEIIPYCAGTQPLTLINSESSPAQSFTLSPSGTLLVGSASNAANTLASVQVDECGKLVYGPVNQGTTGFAPTANGLSFGFEGRSQFCSVGGNVFVNLETPGCEVFEMATTQFYEPGSC